MAADTGAIGGSGSHEFHVLADAGEDTIAFSTESDYAANVELAGPCPTAMNAPPSKEMELVDTPNAKTITELVEQFNQPVEQTAKTLVVEAAEGGLIALLVRGDHELNEIKAEKLPQVASLCASPRKRKSARLLARAPAPGAGEPTRPHHRRPFRCRAGGLFRRCQYRRQALLRHQLGTDAPCLRWRTSAT